MKQFLQLAFALVLASASVGLAQRAGGVEKRSYHFEEAGRDIEYRLFVPESYTSSRPAPLLVLLHGLGSNPAQVMRYAGVTEEAGRRGWIVVAPFGYNERGWYGSRGPGKDGLLFGQPGDPDNLGELSEKDVMNVLEIVREEFAIDASRIYLAGHSMGGGGTIYLASAYPDIWAAVAPMAPAFQGGAEGTLGKMKHIPVFLVTGEADRLIPVRDVRRWAGKMEELGMTHHYEEIPGGNHVDSITRNLEMMGELFAFLAEHRRGGAVAGGGREFRDFTNSTGRTIRARVLRVDDGRVSIVREDGRSFTIPVGSLSEADQDYLEGWSPK